MFILLPFLPLFFFTNPPTTEIYTLSLHDALPISGTACLRPPSRLGLRLDRRQLRFRFRKHPPLLIRRRRQTSDRKSTRLNSSHRCISYAVFCLKKKKKKNNITTSKTIITDQHRQP